MSHHLFYFIHRTIIYVTAALSLRQIKRPSTPLLCSHRARLNARPSLHHAPAPLPAILPLHLRPYAFRDIIHHIRRLLQRTEQRAITVAIDKLSVAAVVRGAVEGKEDIMVAWAQMTALARRCRTAVLAFTR